MANAQTPTAQPTLGEDRSAALRDDALTPQAEPPRRAPHRTLRPDAQAFDEIRIATVPRYKESGLSGDEWRISAKVEFYRKGRLVHESGGFRNVETVCNFLPYLHATAIDDGKAYFAGEGDFCDQEGCSATATVTYFLKSRYCHEGHKTPVFWQEGEIRRFCDRHRTRGDCGLDDADANYATTADARTASDASAADTASGSAAGRAERTAEPSSEQRSDPQPSPSPSGEQ